ncbi:MAG: DNA gyrase subunit A [Oscillospiraceae bacterium]
MRDETDLSGLKLAIDLKRGVDPDKLMTKLFRMTPLQDTFSLQFQHPHRRDAPGAWGCGEILGEWTAWRTECVRRRVYFVLQKQEGQAAPAARA